METKRDEIKTEDASSFCPECEDEIVSPETECVYCTEDPDGRDVVDAGLDEELELMRLRLRELKTRCTRTESCVERKKRRRTRRG